MGRMLGKLLAQVRSLRPAVRSVVLLYCVYTLAGSMLGTFLQIFIFQKFTSVYFNITATLVLYSGIMAGFALVGIVAGLFRANLKRGFLACFLLMSLPIFLLLYAHTEVQVYAIMFIHGFGEGLFWLLVSPFELSLTHDSERDFYSSVIGVTGELLGLVGPASATFLIWFSCVVLHLGTYTLLFIVSPAIYLLGLLCLAHLPDFRPTPLTVADVVHFTTDRRNKAAFIYSMGTGLQQVLGLVPQLVALAILQSALSVGAYSTVFAIISTVAIIALAPIRRPGNRLHILGATTLILAAAIIWLGYSFSLAGLIIFTLAEALILPTLNVSSHVIDLSAMEIGLPQSKFYATMILREFTLWTWRNIGGLCLIVAVHYFGTARLTLSAGLYMLAASFIITYVGAVLLARAQRSA